MDAKERVEVRRLTIIGRRDQCTAATGRSVAVPIKIWCLDAREVRLESDP